MVRYHGVLSSAADWRSRVVPNPPVKLDLPLRHRGARRIDWANLLRRVFLLDVLACACGGTRRPTARKILGHLGLPSEAPALGRARIDQGELFGTGPPADECQLPPPENMDQRTDAA